MLCGRFLFFLIAFLLNTQALFAQLSEEALQRMAQSYVERRNIENLWEYPDLLTDIQDIFREHSDVLNTIAQMPTHPEFEPYIEKYKALKAQYTGRQSIVNTKIFLSTSPLVEGKQPEVMQGRCFYSQNWILIDRDAWEYYQGNDDVREHVLFHELGHCDLNQGHITNNYIMDNDLLREDLSKGRTIDWDPIYREFFLNTRARRQIICSENGSQRYGYCFVLKRRYNIESGCVDYGRSLGWLCYKWKDTLFNELNNNISAFKRHLLTDIE